MVPAAGVSNSIRPPSPDGTPPPMAIQRASNAASPALLQDNRPAPFSARTSTQNLSSVLSDPRKRRREMGALLTRDHGYDFVEKTSVPPSPHLRHVKIKHFQDYLHNISKKYQRHLKDEKRLALTQKRRDVIGAETDPQASLALYHRLLPELQNIPQMFMSSSFNLRDPLVFQAVFMAALDGEAESSSSSFPNHPTTSSTNPFGDEEEEGRNPFDEDEDEDNPFKEDLKEEKARARLRLKPNRKLQDELSGHLDSVETRIGLQIAARSGAFFKAMSSHDELQTHLAQTKYAVQRLRGRMQFLDRTLPKKSLRVLALHRAHANKEALLHRLELMRTVSETQTSVQLLLHSQDFLAALDVIRTTQLVLDEQLPNIIAFGHLGMQLSELENVIGRMLKEELVSLIKTELSRPLNSSSDSQTDGTQEQELSSMILGCLRIKDLRFVSMVKEEAIEAYSKLLREAVIAELGSSDGESRRKLNWTAWFTLFKSLLQLTNAYTARVATITFIMTDLVDIAGGRCGMPADTQMSPSALPAPSALRTPLRTEEFTFQLDEAQHSDLRDQLTQALLSLAQAVQSKLCRVLNSRAKDGSFDKLSIEEIQELLDAIRHFGKEAQGILHEKPPNTMWQGVHGHLSAWVNRWTGERKTKLSAILDSEHWKAAEVPALFQAIADRLGTEGVLRDAVGTVSGTSQPRLSLYGEDYVVVGTALILFQMMGEYCGVVEALPSLAPDLVSKLVDLLKSFNSRTCQLILGAGAMHTIQIKTITVRHIGLAWRSLELIARLVPSVEEEFVAALPASHSNLQRHLLQVAKDLNDHIDELRNKVIALTETVIRKRLSTWKGEGESAPSSSMSKIAKLITSLYDQLSPILPQPHVERLLLKAHDLFKEAFRETLIDQQITPSDSQRYGFVCSEWSFYMESLQQLPPAVGLPDTLNHVYAGK